MKSDLVACAVCGKSMRTINNRHLAGHGMTADAYRAAYPGHPLLCEDAQRKLSERSVRSNAERRGKPRSEEDRAAIREGIRERRPSTKGISKGPMSEEHRRKLSESHRASFAAGRVHGRIGKTVAPETRAKIADSLRGRVIGSGPAMKAIETKRARGQDLAFFRGRSHTEETKNKIAERSRKFYAETRAGRRAVMLGRFEEADVRLLNQIDAPVFELECRTCGHRFERTPQRFQPSKFNPRVCNQCYPQSKTSVAEDEVAALIRGMLEPHESVVRSEDKIIEPLELDIYIPTRKIAIEYCGLYWHSDLAGKHKFYHRFKLDACRKLGIRLITIFEDEWLTKRGIVENMLRNALGENQTRIDARACTVEELDSATANAFMATHHVGGRGSSSVRYGLRHAGTLVSVMTFRKGEISRKQTGWEINRFASLGGTNVRGAASRLFTAFLRAQSPDTVTSYADLRWGTGAVYGSIGFVHQGLTIPNYWYFRPNELQRHHRYGLRKTTSDPAGMTEWQARQAQGWNRIFDCGHAKWVWVARQGDI